LAEVEPTMPIGPAWAGWSCVTAPLPAMVSTTGMPCFGGEIARRLSAPE
jgi:hypothetical protein